MGEPVPLDSLDIVFSLETIRAYGGCGEHVHSSGQVAASFGLPGPICWGTLTIAPFFDMVAGVAGADWLVGGALESQLRRPVVAGDVVHYSGIERRDSREDGERIYELSARTERNGVVATARATSGAARPPRVAPRMAAATAAAWPDTDGSRLLELFRTFDRTTHVVGRPVPVLKRVRRPEFTWRAALPDLEFLPLEYEVDEAAVTSHRALGAAWAAPDAFPHGVPPLMFADEPNQCVNTLFARTGRYHVGHAIRAVSPIAIGSTVVSRARVAQRMQREGREYARIDCTVSALEVDGEQPAVHVSATVMF